MAGARLRGPARFVGFGLGIPPVCFSSELVASGSRPGPGGLRSVVAATAEELRFSHCLEGRGLQRFRPTGRKNAEPPIDDNPAKELQAAPLQVPLF